MARIIRDTTYRWRGPWLIEMQDLRALDSAVSEAKAHVAAAQHEYDESRISAAGAVAAGGRKATESAEQYALRLEESENRARESYAIEPLETTIEFELATKKKIRCKSISEGLNNTEVIEGCTVVLSVNLEAARRRVSLNFDIEDEEVYISAYPAGDVHIEIAFGMLKKWAAVKQPSRFYRFWGRSPSNAIFLLPVVWIMVSEYREVRQPMDSNWAALATAGTILIITSVLLFGRPAAVMGIGTTQKAPANRRRWIQLWLSVVPLAVFGLVVGAVLGRGMSQH